MWTVIWVFAKSNWKPLLIVALLVGIEQFGEHRIQAQWDAEKARLEVIAEQAREQDAAARKAVADQHKKDIDYAKSQAGRDAVSKYLRDHGMLPAGPAVPGSGSGQAQSSSGANGTGSQCGTCTGIEEFANRCGQDALTIGAWQEWAMREGLETD